MPSRPTPPPGEFLYLLAGDPDDFVAACADLLPADIAEALNDLPAEAASKVLGSPALRGGGAGAGRVAAGAPGRSGRAAGGRGGHPADPGACRPTSRCGCSATSTRADRARLLHVLDAPTRDQLKLLMSYPPQSAGGLMTTEFVGVPHSWTALQVRLHVAREGSEKETVYAIYVLDEQAAAGAGALAPRSGHGASRKRRSPRSARAASRSPWARWWTAKTSPG